jgi:uncharacterized protein (DUF1015 family)
MRACRANLSPVFGLYEEPGGIATLLNEATLAPPVVDTATPDGEHHRLWAISEPGQIRQITKLLEPLPIYIADGHHRYETALAYRHERRQEEPGAPANAAFNYVMMVLVAISDPGLVILPTHRLVQEAPGICLDQLESRLQVYFDVEAWPLHSEGKRELSEALVEMCRRGRHVPAFGAVGLKENTFHLLMLRDRVAIERLMPAEHSQAWRRLDVSVLHAVILQHLLGLPDVKGREDLAYTRDPIYAWESVLEGRSRLAFFLNPPKASEIRDVADADDRMPPKSTYFHPKLPTGLVINPLSGTI